MLKELKEGMRVVDTYFTPEEGKLSKAGTLTQQHSSPWQPEADGRWWVLWDDEDPTWSMPSYWLKALAPEGASDDRHPSSRRFHEILAELGELHDKKQKDYGREDDPFANVRASVDFGMESWVGAMVRADDKMRRIKAVANGSELVNEGVEDSFKDLAVYAIIGLVLYEEGQP